VKAGGHGLHLGHCSDPGRQRELNEDSYLILTAPVIASEIDALLAVADGMGGHRAGDVASRTLIDMLEDLFTSSAYQQYVAYNPQHPDYYVVVLKEVLEEINERLHRFSAGRPELEGMGTTATVALLARGYLFWGHAGDSRAYLLHDGSFQRLTHDHTWVAEQVEAGHMTPQEAAQHPRRNALTQSLGNSFLVRVERGMQPVQPGDLLLLCSDGLSTVVSDVEVREILLAEPNPQRACERLVTAANQRGGPDNITVLVARLTSHGPGGNVIGGRVRGPAQSGVTVQAQIDTLKMKRSQRQRLIRTGRRLARPLGVTLVLLLGALFSGTGMLLAELIPILPRELVIMIAAVIVFVLGVLLGWLLRPVGPE
jgi:serine/threonine protein phosphatase PrpC